MEIFFRNHMDVEPKIGGFYLPNHQFVHRVFHYFSPSILVVLSLFLETPILYYFLQFPRLSCRCFLIDMGPHGMSWAQIQQKFEFGTNDSR